MVGELTASAKSSPRLRMSFDLWNRLEDGVRRMIDAIEPGRGMVRHRHLGSSETVVCIRGHFVENFYDENGVLTEVVDMVPGGVMVNVPAGQWHNLESLESGTVLFEGKDWGVSAVEGGGNLEMKYLKAIWQLCGFLFWPQWRIVIATQL